MVSILEKSYQCSSTNFHQISRNSFPQIIIFTIILRFPSPQKSYQCLFMNFHKNSRNSFHQVIILTPWIQKTRFYPNLKLCAFTWCLLLWVGACMPFYKVQVIWIGAFWGFFRRKIRKKADDDGAPGHAAPATTYCHHIW